MAGADDVRSALKQARQEFLDEHRKIVDMSRRIEAAPGLVELVSHLAEFRSLLESHFGGEEAGDGLYDAIRAIAPRHYGRLDQLEKDHRAFLVEIEKMMDRARACLEGPVAEILSAARALTRRLVDHEATENELLFDTMYMDLGQSE